jgi:hypothetical protein
MEKIESLHAELLLISLRCFSAAAQIPCVDFQRAIAAVRGGNVRERRLAAAGRSGQQQHLSASGETTTRRCLKNEKTIQKKQHKKLRGKYEKMTHANCVKNVLTIRPCREI